METSQAIEQAIALKEEEQQEKNLIIRALKEINSQLPRRVVNEEFFELASEVAILKHSVDFKEYNRTIIVLLVMINWQFLYSYRPLSSSELCLLINYLDYSIKSSDLINKKDIKILTEQGILHKTSYRSQYLVTSEVLLTIKMQKAFSVQVKGVLKRKSGNMVIQEVDLSKIFLSLAEKDIMLKKAIDKWEMRENLATDQTLTSIDASKEIAAIKQDLQRFKNENSEMGIPLEVDKIVYLMLLQLKYKKEFSGFNQTIDALLLMINWEILHSQPMSMRTLWVALNFLGYNTETYGSLYESKKSAIRQLVKKNFLSQTGKGQRYAVNIKVWLAFKNKQSLSIKISGKVQGKEVADEKHEVDIIKFFMDSVLAKDSQLYRIFEQRVKEKTVNLPDANLGIQSAKNGEVKISELTQQIKAIEKDVAVPQENQKLKEELENEKTKNQELMEKLQKKDEQIQRLLKLLSDNDIEIGESGVDSDSDLTSESDSEYQSEVEVSTNKRKSPSSESLGKLTAKYRKKLREEGRQTEKKIEAISSDEEVVQSKAVL